MVGRKFGFWITLFASGCLVGCEAAGGSGSDVCDPGVTQACLSTGGAGVQSCSDDGSGWGACTPLGAPADTGQGTHDTADPPPDTGPGTPDVGPVQDTDDCIPNYEKVCNGSAVVWLDSCGVVGDSVEACTGNSYCSEGICVEACGPHDHTRCDGDDIFWHDSCGDQEGLLEACGDDAFCVGCQKDDASCKDEPLCVKGFYSGDWLVSADPDTKDACGLGNSTYFDLVLHLTVEGGVATATGSVLEFDLEYEGTVVGKKLTLEGTYSQTSMGMTIDHVEKIDVTFDTLEHFWGASQDTFSMLGLPCTLYWDITGVKQ